jgi:hypothetical protein
MTWLPKSFQGPQILDSVFHIDSPIMQISRHCMYQFHQLFTATTELALAIVPCIEPSMVNKLYRTCNSLRAVLVLLFPVSHTSGPDEKTFRKSRGLHRSQNAAACFHQRPFRSFAFTSKCNTVQRAPLQSVPADFLKSFTESNIQSCGRVWVVLATKASHDGLDEHSIIGIGQILYPSKVNTSRYFFLVCELTSSVI